VKISVIVTSYNQKDYLVQTIDSILNQTIRPYELIICDDCSRDGSQELIMHYAGLYPGMITPVFQKKNLGVTRNRNTGIKAAKGDYITTLDGDDLYLPEKLEKEIQEAKRHNAPLVYSNVIYIDEHGCETGIRYKNNRQLEGCIFEKIVTRKYPSPREVLIARKCIEEVGFLDESFRINEDFEWIARLSSRFPFTAVREPLVQHRFHSKGLHRSDSLLLLETLAAVAEKMLGFCKTSIDEDKDKTAEKIRSFLNLTMARIELYKGDRSAAGTYVIKSIRQDWLRSSNYDLMMRLFLPKLFRRQYRKLDPLMMGPLALPFYLVRGVF